MRRRAFGRSLCTAALLFAGVPMPVRAQRSVVVRPPAVDHHQHLFSPAAHEMLAPFGIPAITARDLVALLDSARIDRAVVLSVAYLYASPTRNFDDERERVRAENDWVAEQVRQFPARLIGFCSFNPLKPYALEELERCARDSTLRRGIKLHLGNADVRLGDTTHVAQLERVFRAANAHGMAIVVHLRANFSANAPYGPLEARVFLERLLPAAPDVTVQVAHLAGTGPGYEDPAAERVMQVLADAVARHDPRTRHLWFDVSGIVTPSMPAKDAARMVKLMRRAGIDRMLYGSDAATPGNLIPRDEWAAMRRLPLTAKELDRIARNVAPYLGTSTR